MVDSRESNVPQIVSHFRLERLLGAGGMGAVYKGTDRRDGTPVAIKLLHPHLAEDPSFRERFEREAHVAALLRSPYTVHLLDYGVAERHYFIVMEYVDGETLKDALKHLPLPLNRALRIAIQVARALEEAQARGVVHRDIKPENILLRSEDSVKVSDFGIARQVGNVTLTMPGAFIGTLSYAAPEQLLGQGNTDHRSDIYALGATLYHMLVGRPPFSGSLVEMLRDVRETPPPKEPLASLPADVIGIVSRCLEKDPDSRYQSGSDVAAALERASRPSVASEVETSVEGATAAPPQGEESDPTQLLEARPAAPGRDLVSMELGAPRVGLPFTSRLAAMRYDLTIRNQNDDAIELDLRAEDREDRCHLSLPRRVSIPPGAATTVSVKVRPRARRWTGGRETRTFTVYGSRGGAGQPPIAVSGQFDDLSYGWLSLGGGALSIGGAAVILAALLLPGGDGDSALGGTTLPTEEPLKIGILAPYTGPLSDFGPAFSNAAQLAMNEINATGGVLGQSIELVTADTLSDPQTGVAEARRLIEEDGVHAIMGGAASNLTLPVAEEVTGPSGVLQISPSAASPSLTDAADADFLFRTVLSDAAQGLVLAGLAEEAGFGTVCSMFVDESYGAGLNAVFKDSSPGLTIVEVPHQRGQETFSSELDQCSDADAIAVFTFLETGGRFLLEQALERGVTNFLFVDGIRDPELFTALGWESFDGLRGTQLGVLDLAPAAAFDASYEAAFGEPPPVPFLREAYDAVYLIALAAEKAGSTNPVAIRDALREVANPPGQTVTPGMEGFQEARDLISQFADIDYEGAAGRSDFDENGDSLSGAIEIWRVDAQARALTTERVVRVDLDTGTVTLVE